MYQMTCTTILYLNKQIVSAYFLFTLIMTNARTVFLTCSKVFGNSYKPCNHIIEKLNDKAIILIFFFQDYLLKLFELFLHDNQSQFVFYKHVLNVSFSPSIIFHCFKLVSTFASFENESTLWFQYSWEKGVLLPFLHLFLWSYPLR